MSTYSSSPTRQIRSGALSRPLITLDKLRRFSANNNFTLIDQSPKTFFKKMPSFKVLESWKGFHGNR